jgi:hypothetical protein
MVEERHNPMQCAEFEALLAEASDGALGAAEMERCDAHTASCPLCAAQFALAGEGRALLRGLPELEPPAYLVQKILNVTSEVAPRAKAEKRAARDWSFGLRPLVATVMQPRFGMSFAMAFFSLTLLLNIAGVRVSDVRNLDLRPSAVRSNVVKSYYETTGRVQKYYENLRFVYQVQSTLRDLRNAATSQEDVKPQAQPQQPAPQQQQRPGSDTSERPRERQEKNERYSLDRPAIQMAAASPAEIRFVEDRRTA